MEAMEVDQLIVVSEIDEQGAFNYDEALKTSLNELMEAIPAICLNRRHSSWIDK